MKRNMITINPVSAHATRDMTERGQSRAQSRAQSPRGDHPLNEEPKVSGYEIKPESTQ